MASDLCVPLSSLSKDSIKEFGEIAAALGDLLSDGYPIPKGFVIPREAILDPLREAGVLHEIFLSIKSKELRELEKRCSRISSLISGLNIGPDMWRDLERNLQELDGFRENKWVIEALSPSYEVLKKVVVTSLLEWGVGNRRIKEVFLKLLGGIFTPSLLSAVKVEPEDVVPSMLFLDSVDVRCSGWIISEGENVKITSKYGISLEIEEPDADMFRVTKSDLSIRSSIAEKKLQTLISKGGFKVVKKVEEELVKAPSLSDDQVRRLATLYRDISWHLDKEPVVQWVLPAERADEEFLITLVLPTRPLPLEKIKEKRLVVQETKERLTGELEPGSEKVGGTVGETGEYEHVNHRELLPETACLTATNIYLLVKSPTDLGAPADGLVILKRDLQVSEEEVSKYPLESYMLSSSDKMDGLPDGVIPVLIRREARKQKNRDFALLLEDIRELIFLDPLNLRRRAVILDLREDLKSKDIEIRKLFSLVRSIARKAPVILLLDKLTPDHAAHLVAAGVRGVAVPPNLVRRARFLIKKAELRIMLDHALER